MSLGVVSSKTAFGFRPRSDISVSQPFARYKLYEGTGTTISDHEGVHLDLTVAGTTTNIWDNAGWLTAAGNNYAVSRGNATLDELFTLDSGAHGILVALDYYSGAAPGGSEYLMAYGASFNTAGSGGLAITHLATDKINIRYLEMGGTTVTAQAQTGTLGTGKKHIAMYVDVVNFTMSLYINGSLDASKAIPSTDILTANSSFGFCLLARDNGAGTPAGADFIGQSARDARLANVFIKRFDSDPSSIISTLVRDLNNNPGDISFVVDGW